VRECEIAGNDLRITNRSWGEIG